MIKVNQMKLDESINPSDNIEDDTIILLFQIWKGFCFGQVEFLYKYKLVSE